MLTNVKQLLSGGMLLAAICISQTDVAAQQRGRRSEGGRNGTPGGGRGASLANSDTANALKTAAGMAAALKPGALKPYREVITDKAVSYKGFVTVHKVADKYFLEVPDAVLGREILIVNRIGIAPADFRSATGSIGYAGDVIGQQVFHFSKGEGNKLFIRMKSYKERAYDSSSNGLARSLDRNNMEPILSSIALKAVSDSLHCSVIEITDLMGQDNILFGFSAAAKTSAGLTAIVPDRSYIEAVKNVGNNIAFSFIRTYTKSSGISQSPFTFQLRSGMILLPETPMKERFADKRTAYQEISYIDFDSNPLGVVNKGVIYRWRLEPSDRKAYLAGKAVAPVKPVRIYLDPSMPAKWKPYVKAGMEAWNTAFRKAGFSNAIEVVMPGRKDTISYLDDVDRSAVVFMPGNGESRSSLIVDPRSGEILQVQLNFYLGTLEKLYKQYFIQAGALDKAANKPVFDDALMGRLVEAWFTQATGRLLGLKPNTGASFANTIADLRSNAWLKDNAFNGSATDPVLVNYVVQPEDRIDVRRLLAGVSATDEWMINWGYRVIPGNEAATLSKWISGYKGNGAELYLGDPAQMPAMDPRNQAGDLGNDVVEASLLGISNLKKVTPNLLAWTSEPASGHERAAQLYDALLDQYAAYAKQVIRQIGGIYINIRNSDQEGYVYSFVPAAAQKKAVRFLHEQVFETPAWLQNKELYMRTAACFDSVTNVQRAILAEAMSRHVLSRLQTAASNDTALVYTPLDYLTDLAGGLFAELKDNKPVNLPRRELQKEYISGLLALQAAFAKTDNDLPAVIGYHAKQLLNMLDEKRSAYTGLAAAHASALYERLCIGLYGSTVKKN